MVNNSSRIKTPPHMPSRAGLAKYKPRLSPDRVRLRSDLNTIYDVRSRLVSQRDDMIFLWDITKRPEIRNKDISLIEKADALMWEVHEGSKRDSGEPYHFHPRAVAMSLIEEFGIHDVNMVCAALLHDVIEDGAITRGFIANEFNEDIAALVDGVTKLGKEIGKSRGALSLEKLVFASAHDPRVAILKLSDNLHNIRTIKWVEKKRGRAKAEEIARETLKVYSPLAHILGMRLIWVELEETVYEFLDKEGMDEIHAMIARKKEKAGGALNEVVRRLKKEIDEKVAVFTEQLIDSYEIKVENRHPSHLYRVKRRKEKQGQPFTEDELMLYYYKLNFIVDGPEEENDGIMCSMVSSIVSRVCALIPGRYRDFISSPRPNGYRAIENVVDFGEHGFLRVGFMTPKMERWADLGILSVDYRDADATLKLLRKAFHTLKDEGMQDLSEGDVAAVLKGIAFNITVKTERGESREIAQGATVADLAYDIDPVLGYEAVSGRVHGKDVGLGHVLQDGDYVVVLREKKKRLTPDSLRNVNTPYARERIKEFLRREEKERTLDIKDVGSQSLEKAAKEKFIKPKDIARGPLALAVLGKILPLIDHNTEELEKLWDKFYPLANIGGGKIGADGIGRLKELEDYFSYVVGVGAIDSRRIVSEYVKMQKAIASAIPELIALTSKIKSTELKEIVSGYLLLAEKIKSSIEIGDINSIKDAPEFLRDAEGGEEVAASARVIYLFTVLAAHVWGEITPQLLPHFMVLANEVEKVQPTRIEVTVDTKNRRGLALETLTKLSDQLGIDIPFYHAEGAGDGPAHIKFEITPESNFQRLQIINIASEFGKVKVRRVAI
ncbi:MAG: HD domain-containing protein [Candidatus Margulisiibacteriota bacterium]